MDKKKKKRRNPPIEIEMDDDGDKCVRLYTLAPFLFAYSDLDHRWMQMLKASGLLVTDKREESLEALTDKELEIVDIVDGTLSLVSQEYPPLVSSKEKDVQLSEVFKMFERLESSVLTYQHVLTQASEQKLFQYFWQRMANAEVITDVQKFSVVFVLKQYYKYAKNCKLIKDTDSRRASDSQRTLHWKSKGNKSYRDSRFDEAVDDYTKAIKLSHFDHVLYGNRAQAYLMSEKYREALSDSRRALAVKPDWVKGWYRLSEAAIALRMFFLAENANRKGVQICLETGDKYNNMKDLIDQQRRIPVEQAKAEESHVEPHEESNEEDPDDSASDVPDLVSSDEASSIDDQDSLDENDLETDFPNELQKCVSEGRNHYLNHKSVHGARQFSQALDLISQHGITDLNITEEEQLSIIHVFILCCVSTSSSKWLHAGLKCLDKYQQSAAQHYRALLLYDQALCCMTLFRFEKAKHSINSALDILSTSTQVETLKWPGGTTEIDSAKPNNLKVHLSTLSMQCVYSPLPEGHCRVHTNPEDQVTKIYFDNPEFKGMVRLICHEKCHVDFHPRCWKDYKHTLGERVVDRAVLDGVCLTQDCTALGHKIVIFKPDNLPSGKAIISETKPIKVVMPKEIQKMKKASEKKIQAKAARQERRREMRSKASEPKPSPTVASVAESSPVPEPAPSTFTVSDDRGRTGAEDGVRLTRRDKSAEDNRTKGGKGKQKIKKKKDKNVLSVEVKFSDKRHLESAESAAESADPTSHPFSVPPSLRNQLHEFHENRLSPLSGAIFMTNEEKVVENTFSYFADFFSSHGPQPLDSLLLQESMEDFPEETISVIKKAGGVRKFLLGSLQFYGAENIISLMCDAHRARQMADDQRTESVQHERPAFQLNPQAPKFTPLNKQNSPVMNTTAGLDSFGAGDSAYSVKEDSSQSGRRLSLTDTPPTSSGDSVSRVEKTLPYPHSKQSSPVCIGAEFVMERPRSYPSYDSTREPTLDSTDDLYNFSYNFSIPREVEQLQKNAITDIDSDSISSMSPIFPDSVLSNVCSPKMVNIRQTGNKLSEESPRLNPQPLKVFNSALTLFPSAFPPNPLMTNLVLVSPSHSSPSPPFSSQFSEEMLAGSLSLEVNSDSSTNNRESVKSPPDLILKCQQLEQELHETKEQLVTAMSHRDILETKLHAKTDELNKELKTWKDLYYNLKSEMVTKDEKVVKNLTVMQERFDNICLEKHNADEELMHLNQLCTSQATRASQAELVLLEEKRKTQVEFLEQRLRDIDSYCVHLDSCLKLENQEDDSELEVVKARMEWYRSRRIYRQLILDTNEEFDKKEDLVKNGHPLPSLLPLQLPSPPPLPQKLHFSHPRHADEGAANGDVSQRPKTPFRQFTPFQRATGHQSPLNQFPKVRQPAPIRPLVPLRVPLSHRQPLRPLSSAVKTDPFQRLPSNPLASSSQSFGKTTMELIMGRLRTLFPLCGRHHFLELIQEYRTECGGSLSGVPMDKIIEHVIEAVQEKLKKEEGNQDQRAKNGPNENGNHEEIAQEVDPCPICHEEITEADFTTLDCLHRFHSKCIRRWLKDQNTCPNCRTHALLRDDFPSLR